MTCKVKKVKKVTEAHLQVDEVHEADGNPDTDEDADVVGVAEGDEAEVVPPADVEVPNPPRGRDERLDHEVEVEEELRRQHQDPEQTVQKNLFFYDKTKTRKDKTSQL